MNFSIGQVVISKAGRDKGKAFIITAIKGEYIYLVDGKCRLLENPKKKKLKHVQPTWTVDAALKEALEGQKYIKNADFAATLKKFGADSKND